jgi:hypothetical protein
MTGQGQLARSRESVTLANQGQVTGLQLEIGMYGVIFASGFAFGRTGLPVSLEILAFK